MIKGYLIDITKQNFTLLYIGRNKYQSFFIDISES